MFFRFFLIFVVDPITTPQVLALPGKTRCERIAPFTKYPITDFVASHLFQTPGI